MGDPELSPQSRTMAPARQQQSPRNTFIESMECLPVAHLPEGPEWTYEIKLDGFRLEAVKHRGKTTLYSRRATVLNRQFPYIATALASLPDFTVLDGELVAIDPHGRSNFSLLQSFRAAESQIRYYVFDILILKGGLLTHRPLEARRAILDKVVPRNNHVGLSVVEYGSAASILKSVTEQGLEGVVAKRSDSPYEPGKRSGAWCKHRIDI